MMLFLKAARHHLEHFNVPSPAQLDAGNYRKGHRKFAGLDVSIENPRGSIRRGVDRGGKAWETPMHHDYGYIKRTLGVDGDNYDCYLGPHEGASHAYLVTTKAPPAFTADDEQKAMLGFHGEDAAREAFLQHYDNPKFCGRIDAVPMDRFRRELRTTRANPRMLKALLVFR